ncbi:hypothetical protein [Paracoccus sp. MKU1]|uniref:hypothetical protein n=1 Tax=Paracoccus sp. MKU1 TaxID=1745182 RepID=UPI000A6BFE76|nr:hypothetical protein [Paracoccus sp. MKU1]
MSLFVEHYTGSNPEPHIETSRAAMRAVLGFTLAAIISAPVSLIAAALTYV